MSEECTKILEVLNDIINELTANEEYTIVSGETLEALNAIVNENTANGWKVRGGFTVVSKKLWADRPKTARGELVAQALVRVVENE